MGPRVGILLGRDRARAVLAAPGRRGAPPRVLASAEAPLDPEAWSGAPERAGEALAALARALPSGARRVDRPVMLAIPDPVASEDRLTFRELPASPREVAELVRFRIARDHRRPAGTIACAAQVAGPAEGGVEVLVRVVPRAVLAAVEAGAHRAGFLPRRLDTWSGFALDRAAQAGPAGALLWSDGAWWALMCWSRAGAGGSDGPGRDETHLHAEWRRAGDGPALAGKAVRVAKSFALHCGLERLPLSTDLAPAEDAAERIGGGDPIVVPAPARRLPDPALCVALS